MVAAQELWRFVVARGAVDDHRVGVVEVAARGAAEMVAALELWRFVVARGPVDDHRVGAVVEVAVHGVVDGHCVGVVMVAARGAADGLLEGSHL